MQTAGALAVLNQAKQSAQQLSVQSAHDVRSLVCRMQPAAQNAQLALRSALEPVISADIYEVDLYGWLSHKRLSQ